MKRSVHSLSLHGAMNWLREAVTHLFTRPEPKQVSVDHRARGLMACAIRDLVARRITNQEFDDRASLIGEEALDDPALYEVYLACWTFYDDFRVHNLRRLDLQERREVARAILFLRSDEPYCWGPFRAPIKPFGFVSSTFDVLISFASGLWLPISASLRVAMWWLRSKTPELVPPQQPDSLQRELVWPFADFASLSRANRACRLLGAN